MIEILTDTPQEYEEYRKIMLGEAEKILSRKGDFIREDRKKIDERIIYLRDLTDFFYLEGEYEIVQELNSLSKALQVRKFLGI